MLECALQWFLPFAVLLIKMSQVVPIKKYSRFYSTNKFVKQDTNCQNSLKTCLLNQVPASHRLACAWFLKIDPVQIVSVHAFVCVCLRPRLLITSGVI